MLPRPVVTSSTMLTCSGLYVDVAAPVPGDIHIEDIAHHLAMTVRFGGAVREFYSVAQHSVLVSQIVGLLHTPNFDLGRREAQLVGLLHDAPEYLLGDCPTPVKQTEAMAGFRELERILWHAVVERFRLPYQVAHHMPGIVEHADRLAYALESRDVRSPPVHVPFTSPNVRQITIEPWPANIAALRFMQEFRFLTGSMGEQQAKCVA